MGKVSGCRPTKPVAWWEDSSQILGGRDCLAGGTWLASTRNGRLAFLTNVMEPDQNPNAKSRGELPVRFLEVNESSPFLLDISASLGIFFSFELITTVIFLSGLNQRLSI